VPAGAPAPPRPGAGPENAGMPMVVDGLEGHGARYGSRAPRPDSMRSGQARP
jgi:hypothetical protein